MMIMGMRGAVELIGIGGGFAVVFNNALNLVSPPVDILRTEEIGPWTLGNNSLGHRREIEVLVAHAQHVPLDAVLSTADPITLTHEGALAAWESRDRSPAEYSARAEALSKKADSYWAGFKRGRTKFDNHMAAAHAHDDARSAHYAVGNTDKSGYHGDKAAEHRRKATPIMPGSAADILSPTE